MVQPSYNVVGRLSTILTGSTTYASGFQYNTAGQVTAFNYGNGVTATLGYTAERLQLQSLSYTKPGQTLLSLSYGYTQNDGNNGQIASITDSTGTQEAGRSVTYSYDSLYRLSTAVTTGSTSYPQWGLAWTYDRYGNRTNQTQTAGSPPMNSVAISATTNRLTDPGYAYDANGNMTNDGLNQLGYDAENHIVSAAGAAYTYDGAGRRVKKVSGSTTTVYAFSGANVIAEYENGAVPASPTREYIYSGGLLLAKVESSATTYYYRDHLSNRALADSSGNVSGQRGHYPFGETWYESGTTIKLKFTTYERDGETGNDYAMARYYVNRLGRFSSPDLFAGSISNPQSLNRYAYVRNDPVNFNDPLGLARMAVTFCYEYYQLPIPDVRGGGVVTVCSTFYLYFWDGSGGGGGSWEDPGGGSGGKKKDLIKAALEEKNLSKCLHKYFGRGTILTNENLPRIDASKDLPGATVGQTDPKQVPDIGRGTVQIDKGIFTSLPANDPYLTGTYLHETANVLAIQRFTDIQPRAARARRGPLGGPPTEDQRREARSSFGDPDIGNQFEKCLRGRD